MAKTTTAEKINYSLVKLQLVKLIQQVERGELDTKKANCMIGGWKGVAYVIQLEDNRARLEADLRIAESTERLIQALELGDLERIQTETAQHKSIFKQFEEDHCSEIEAEVKEYLQGAKL